MHGAPGVATARLSPAQSTEQRSYISRGRGILFHVGHRPCLTQNLRLAAEHRDPVGPRSTGTTLRVSRGVRLDDWAVALGFRTCRLLFSWLRDQPSDRQIRRVYDPVSCIVGPAVFCWARDVEGGVGMSRCAQLSGLASRSIGNSARTTAVVKKLARARSTPSNPLLRMERPREFFSRQAGLSLACWRKIGFTPQL